MQFYRLDSSFTLKKDASPLTAADMASHAYLVKSLERLLPGVPVISEESQDGVAKTISEGDRFWLIDPLDGTKEFLKRTNEFTVNIALVEAGRPVLGVVHAPALALTYWAQRDIGAWRRSDGEPAVRIQTRPVDMKGLAVVASKDHAGSQVAAMLARMPGAALTSMGSSLKFCLVADGKADLYLRDLPTMEWDTAAAQCIVETAGGGVYELSGAALRYGKPDLRNSSIMTVGDLNFSWRGYVSPSPVS